MHYFISAGEPSGDIHGQNLIAAIRRQDPLARFTGFGGDRMEAAGCSLLYPLCKLSVMWFLHVFRNIITFWRLQRKAIAYFQTEKPDAVVLIDFPGFHWHLAKAAKACGIPVFYFVPPQLWAWGGWRVKKMRESVDCVLTALPFEHEWYLDRGVNSQFIGHPFYDDLAAKELDRKFIEEQTAKPGPLIALLPGSRMQEVTKNFADMLDTVERLQEKYADVRFMAASFNQAQADVARQAIATRKLPVEVYVGKTSEIIEAAECCLMVSGSVCLEVMHRLKPAVVIYRLGPISLRVGRAFMKVQYITLVNLLAKEMLYPEFLTAGNASVEMAERLDEWLANPSSRQEVIEKLQTLKERFAEPGACERAAKCIFEGTLKRRSSDGRRTAA